MRTIYLILLTVVCTMPLLLNAQSAAADTPRTKNRAYQWGEIALTCTGNDTERCRPRPTVTSRFLGLIWTAVFDAWSRYDRKALPVYLKQVKRRPPSEHSLRNKEIAISYAAYRCMLCYYYSDAVLLRSAMLGMGLDPDNASLDPTQAAGIGNLAAKQVIESRRFDGANQTGSAPGSDGKAYSDYTGYQPVNSADSLTDISRWQPKYFSDGNGGKYLPPCLTPQWGKVSPLFLETPGQFRPAPPPAIGSAALKAALQEVIDLQASLTNQQKGLIEFMRDGPKSVQQAGHWFMFAQEVSVRDKHGMDEDVKMYFLVAAVAMDAFIACWDAKMYYDFARPYSLVHQYYADEMIKLWGGPDLGFTAAAGKLWRPYSPETFLCPPFPSYVSGHSTVSAACAEALRLFTGNDYFGSQATIVPGAMTEPLHQGDPVILQFPSFTETANMAGHSRVLGGYHIQSDNTAGLKLGRQVATTAWKKYLQYTRQKTSKNI